VPSEYVHKRECESERENDRMGERMGAESVDEVSECEGEQEKRERKRRERTTGHSPSKKRCHFVMAPPQSSYSTAWVKAGAQRRPAVEVEAPFACT
jgi:hypothetical protein